MLVEAELMAEPEEKIQMRQLISLPSYKLFSQ